MTDIDDETRRIARTFAPDFYISALLCPPAARPGLVALAAFAGDVERIVLEVSDPALAEIRLQWWRDVVAAGVERDERSGSPLADQLVASLRGHGLTADVLAPMLDARVLDLYADPLLDEAALEAYLDHAYGTLFRVAARMLSSDRASIPSVPPQTVDAGSRLITAAAETYGRARLLCHTAAHLARGRSPFPGAMPAGEAELRSLLQNRIGETRRGLAAVRALWRGAPGAARLACLPCGLVEPYLAGTERSDHDPRRLLVAITPLQRASRLWRTCWIGGP